MKKKLILRNKDIADRAYEAVNAALSEDEVHECIIRPFKSNRSLEQNSYYWKLISDIASYTGDDLESTSMQMKAIHLKPLSRHKLPNGNIYVTYPSTSDMKTNVIAEFCEKIEAWAFTNLGFVRNLP